MPDCTCSRGGNAQFCEHNETPKLRTARPGSISSRTLKLDDLLSAFADTLEQLVQDNADEWCSDAGRQRRDAFLGLVWEARECEPHSDPDFADDCIVRLEEALDRFAPEGHSFSAHEGDGADFGYWPIEGYHSRCEDCGGIGGCYASCASNVGGA